MTIATYPANLPGLILNAGSIKTPILSTASGVTVSGREVRLGLYANPLWEWTLTYDGLDDSVNGLKTLMGFYLAQFGSLLPFQFLDPDDNTVAAQLIGEGNLIAQSQFTLVRTFGGTSGSGTEPIGMLNAAKTFNVYLNGVLKTEGTDYTINTATPVNNFVQFVTPPALGVLVTVDMSYYFWVRFKDDQYDFNKFMNQLWEMKKVILHSLRS